ncbi:MAG: AmmeMemoRadiSam system protein B [Candidatus Aminicenantes bacterium]|nr:AmmeMemoRadiSam system protein B [Candidatus Aminicenantes bacterium]
MIRKPAVAGQFYPGDAARLKDMLDHLVDPIIEKKKALGIISPHAGFIYSGGVAGAVFSSVFLPEKYIIIGPNHAGAGALFSLYEEGFWETPLGKVRVDKDLIEVLKKNSDLIETDQAAHSYEHSLEVQIPFIQYFKTDFSIVPITVSPYASLDQLKELGESIAKSIHSEDILLVASTDMSHYISQEQAKEKDFLAIEKILNLDPEGLFQVVKHKHISMCGFQPTIVVLTAAKILGAGKGELIKYQTSGDVSGDYREVVGYAGIRIL